MTHLKQSAARCLSLLLLTTFLVACSDTESDEPTGTETDQQTTASIDQNNTDAADTTGGSTGVSDDDSSANGSGSTTADTEADGTNTDNEPATTGENTPTPATPDPVSTDTQPPSPPDDTGTDNPTTDTPDSNTPEPEQPSTDTPGTDTPDQENPTPDGSDSDTPEPEQPDNDNDNGPGNQAGDTVPVSVTGSDESGNEDDSPTETESASINGPFIKDTSRPAGPPSVPEGLTLLMSGEDFLEFSWKPSTDDQSVEAYEIYRDGVLVYTIEHDNPFEFNYRYWISTSYIDCNYTKFATCGSNPTIAGSSYQYQVAAVDNEGMKSELSAPVTYQMAQRQSGGPNLNDYALVLNEEFDGESLDRAVWKTSLPWGPDTVINGELQYFVNLFGSDPIDANPFVLTGSSLQITGTVTPPALLEAANQQPYLSGVISSKDKFQMTYGYVEMKAKLTGGQGFLSTFYLFNQDFFKNKPEIDIAEYISDRPDKIYQTYHYYDSNRARSSDGERHSTPTMESQMGFDLSADFHTYSVLWEPGLVVWYIDGNEVRRLTGVRISDEPMNIIAQLVVGSDWIGAPDPAQLPRVLEIDYIKAWQKQ